MVSGKSKKSGKSRPGRPGCAFGQKMRLHRVRMGLDQASFGRTVGLTRRMVVYYELESEVPPTGDIVAKIAKVLGVSCDSLLDAEPPKEKDMAEIPPDVRQVKRLLQIRKLPRGLQRALLNHLDALLAAAAAKK